jgi:hypothetical protein
VSLAGGGPIVNTIDYITIAALGNAIDFGGNQGKGQSLVLVQLSGTFMVKYQK